MWILVAQTQRVRRWFWWRELCEALRVFNVTADVFVIIGVSARLEEWQRRCNLTATFRCTQYGIAEVFVTLTSLRQD